MALKHVPLRSRQLLKLVGARRELLGRLDIHVCRLVFFRQNHLRGIGIFLGSQVHALAVLHHQISILLLIGVLLGGGHLRRIVVEPGPVHVMNHIGRAFLQHGLFTLAVHLLDPDQSHHRAVHKKHQILKGRSCSVAVHSSVLIVSLDVNHKGPRGCGVLRRGGLNDHVAAVGQAGRGYNALLIALKLRRKVGVLIVCIIRYLVRRAVTVCDRLHQSSVCYVRAVRLVIDDSRPYFTERRIIQRRGIPEIVDNDLRKLLIRHIHVFSICQIGHQIDRESRALHGVQPVRIVCARHLIEGQGLLLYLLIDLVIGNLHHRDLLSLPFQPEMIFRRVCQIAFAGLLLLQVIAPKLQVLDDDGAAGSRCHFRDTVLVIPVGAHTVLRSHVADRNLFAFAEQHRAALILMKDVFSGVKAVPGPCQGSVPLGYGIFRLPVILGKRDPAQDSLIIKGSVLIIRDSNRGLVLRGVRGNYKIIDVLLRVRRILRD